MDENDIPPEYRLGFGHVTVLNFLVAMLITLGIMGLIFIGFYKIITRREPSIITNETP